MYVFISCVTMLYVDLHFLGLNVKCSLRFTFKGPVCSCNLMSECVCVLDKLVGASSWCMV